MSNRHPELDVDPGMDFTSNLIKLTISFDKTSVQVNVSGPIGDKLFCFGLLEMAKECIQLHAQNESKRILVARPELIRQ